MNAWKEITIYVHGITPQEKVKSHTSTYKNLHKMINDELNKLGKNTLGKALFVEWGWKGSKGQDKYLAKAERKIGELTLAKIDKAKDKTINPLRYFLRDARSLFLYGIADMFYYVSSDGQESVRKNVFDKIFKELAKLSKAGKSIPEGLSLTCIGHSAGTVILHDLLYIIFSKRYKTVKELPVYKYLNKTLLNDIIVLGRNNQIRLRKFYTFGSPITPLFFRSNHMIDMVIKNYRKKKGFLKPEEIGIFDCNDLKNPRWLNFWDKDDIIAYPLEFLYDNRKAVIEDHYINVSDSVRKAHGEYWSSKKMAKYIAESY